MRLGPRAGVPESLGEGVVVNLELSNLREEDAMLPWRFEDLALS